MTTPHKNYLGKLPKPKPHFFGLASPHQPTTIINGHISMPEKTPEIKRIEKKLTDDYRSIVAKWEKKRGDDWYRKALIEWHKKYPNYNTIYGNAYFWIVEDKKGTKYMVVTMS